MNKRFLLIFAVIVLIVVGALIFLSNKENEVAIGGQKDKNGCLIAAGYSFCEAKDTCIRQWEEYCTAASPKTVLFQCEDSKSILATFYPKDDKFVDLVLNGENEVNISLPRAISASGARYAKDDESIVFWNKGDTAFITEGASYTQTYKNCALTSDRITAKIGEKKTAGGVSVTVKEVVEDSRCPIDVQCIQAGTVKVRTELISGLGTSTQIFTLSQPITTEAEIVTLKEVQPYTHSQKTIEPQDYRFVFEISKR